MCISLYLILVDLEVLGEVLILPSFVDLGLQLVSGGPGGGGGGPITGGVVRVVLNVLLRLDSLILHLESNHVVNLNPGLALVWPGQIVSNLSLVHPVPLLNIFLVSHHSVVSLVQQNFRSNNNLE